jgi:hypothetical protein
MSKKLSGAAGLSLVLNGGNPYESKYSAYPVGKIDSYPKRAGHVMIIKVNDNYQWLYKIGW